MLRFHFVLSEGMHPDPFSQHLEVDLEEDVVEKLEHRSSSKPIKVRFTSRPDELRFCTF
jgi:hypothetical protein